MGFLTLQNLPNSNECGMDRTFSSETKSSGRMLTLRSAGSPQGLDCASRNPGRLIFRASTALTLSFQSQWLASFRTHSSGTTISVEDGNHVSAYRLPVPPPRFSLSLRCHRHAHRAHQGIRGPHSEIASA